MAVCGLSTMEQGKTDSKESTYRGEKRIRKREISMHRIKEEKRERDNNSFLACKVLVPRRPDGGREKCESFMISHSLFSFTHSKTCTNNTLFKAAGTDSQFGLCCIKAERYLGMKRAVCGNSVPLNMEYGVNIILLCACM